MVLNVLKGLINVLLGALVTILAFRFVLKLFGASESNLIVNWIYSNTSALIEPFNGIISAIKLQEGFIVEISTIMAILAYSLIGMIAFAIIDALSPTYENTPRRYDAFPKTS